MTKLFHPKKLRLLLLALLFLFLPMEAHASSHKSSSQNTSEANTIHTYGGGELFDKVFSTVSMLMYGNATSGLAKTFHAIVRIALAVGGFCCICLAFFREKFEPIIHQFFLPGLAVMSCLLAPHTTIYIQDHLFQKSSSTDTPSFYKVENVPFFLGKIAALVSTVSYKLTSSMESVSHGVNDPLYNWTGHIYAQKNIFEIKKNQLSDPLIEDNFREFCRECVFRDLGIGLYSKEELIHTPTLLQFLSDRTSNIRTMFYRNHLQDPAGSSTEGQFVSCKEAIQNMAPLFHDTTANLKTILIGETESDFHFLLNQKKTGEQDLHSLIKQQVAIQLLKEEVPGTLNSFAAKRAELLQRENQKILGALGANSIVAMRNFFEAVIYMVFPLIILVCLLSFGLKPMIQWIHFTLWVNMWPPFYVVVNFLLNTIWSFRTKHLYGGSFDLTIFTSEGLRDLYSSMESIAAIAMAFIPFLSWILLKGGVSQMVQLASSIMSPAQSAASTAAAETTYGNYNYGNVSLDNTNAHNAQAFRQSYSGALSYGSVSLDSGTETITYTPGEKGFFVRQGDSHLREGVTRTHAFSNAMQDSLTHSRSALSETSKMTSDNLNDSVNNATGLVNDLSKQFQKGDSFNTQTSSGLQEATQYMEGVANDYAQAKGITYDESMREVFSAGIGLSLGLKGSMDGSYQDGSTSSEADNVLQKAFDGQSFQKHFQTLTNASSGEMAHILGGEGLRLHEDLSRSLNQTASSSEQWRAAQQKHDALAELKSYSESQSVSVQQNLNQRFVEFLYEKYQGDTGQITQALDMSGESPEKMDLFKEFTNDFFPKDFVKEGGFSADTAYGQYKAGLRSVEDVSQAYPTRASIIKEGTDKIGFSFGETEGKVATFKEQVDHAQEGYQSSFDDRKDSAIQDYKSRRSSVESSVASNVHAKFGEKSTIPVWLGKGLDKVSQLGGNSQGNDHWATQSYRELFSHSEEESKADEKITH